MYIHVYASLTQIILKVHVALTFILMLHPIFLHKYKMTIHKLSRVHVSKALKMITQGSPLLNMYTSTNSACVVPLKKEQTPNSSFELLALISTIPLPTFRAKVASINNSTASHYTCTCIHTSISTQFLSQTLEHRLLNS